jgi:hypothetical protein
MAAFGAQTITRTMPSSQLENVFPVAAETPTNEFNPLFGADQTFSGDLCGNVAAAQGDPYRATLTGTFNSCTGLVGGVRVSVDDRRANVASMQACDSDPTMAGCSIDDGRDVSQDSRVDEFEDPPLLSSLPVYAGNQETDSTQNGCYFTNQFFENGNQQLAPRDWDNAFTQINVERDVSCFMCKSTIPNLAMDSEAGQTSMMVDSIVSNYCVEIDCTSDQVNQNGTICFRDKSGSFVCRDHTDTSTVFTPKKVNNIITQRTYGRQGTRSNAATSVSTCGEMKTIGRAVAGQWS